MGVVGCGCSCFSNFIVLRKASAVTCATSTLDFVLRGLDGPIVLANSRLPVKALHASKGRGLVATVRVTTTGGPSNATVIPRMYVFFRGRLVHNGHAAGVGTRGFGTFHSFGCPPLTQINVRVGCRPGLVHGPSPAGPLGPRCLFSGGIIVLALFPNVRRDVMASLLRIPKLGTIMVGAFNSKGTPRGR